jgi:hypothetical protein
LGVFKLVKDDTMKWIIILGILGAGAYFIYSYLKNSPVANAVDTVTNTIKTITEKITTPGPTVTLPPTVLTPGGTTITPPAPIDYLFPPAGIPGFIDFIKQGNLSTIGNVADIAIKTASSIKTAQGVAGSKNLSPVLNPVLPIVSAIATFLSPSKTATTTVKPTAI